MLIGAVNKFSLIDFPGEQACIVFTVGCNMKCGYCHNPDFVLPENIKNISKNSIPEEIFFKFLGKRKGLLTGVSICGGEPTLQKDLYDFCKKVKSMGFKLKLDTNGRDPEIIQKLLVDNLLDYIAMDIKNPLKKYSEIINTLEDVANIEKSIEIIKSSNINYEFRTTVVKGIHTEFDIEEISRTIFSAKNYFLQNFRGKDTLDPYFFGESFSKIELEKLRKIANLYINYVGIRD